MGYSSSGGPAVDSLGVVPINPDGSGKSKTFFTVPAKPVGLLVADLNKDGKKYLQAVEVQVR